MEFLEFELPIKDIMDQIDKCKSDKDGRSMEASKTYKILQKKLDETKKSIYGNLTPWQKVQLSRHPNRPYTLDYIENILGDSFLELHGDRNISDDKAMIGGLGKIDNQTFMVVGTQKGNNTKMRQYRNFGMANPEGYRKALRLMKKAEKFNIPIISFIDTPGAYPGLEAEERGQGEAIARNLYEMMSLKVPIIVVIIGEGASGGALGIGVGDTIMMLENTWYSVISPESCSSILWRSCDYKEKAAEVLKLTADDMYKNKLIDKIVKEPFGGAHYNSDEVYKNVKKEIISSYKKIRGMSSKKLIYDRRKRFYNIGKYKN